MLALPSTNPQVFRCQYKQCNFASMYDDALKRHMTKSHKSSTPSPAFMDAPSNAPSTPTTSKAVKSATMTPSTASEDVEMHPSQSRFSLEQERYTVSEQDYYESDDEQDESYMYTPMDPITALQNSYDNSLFAEFNNPPELAMAVATCNAPVPPSELLVYPDPPFPAAPRSIDPLYDPYVDRWDAVYPDYGRNYSQDPRSW